MAKEGIDSFLLDCRTNDNLAEIEAEFSITGFAVVVRLWQKIYAEKGYYCEWIERSPLLFLSQWFGGNSGVTVNTINEIVARCISIGIFNKSLYNKYKILTSEGIQRRYFDVVKRRTEISIVEEYLLVSVANFKGNVNIISISADKNEKNVCRNETSKVKESKVKESKLKESKLKESKGECGRSTPTLDDIREYCSLNGLRFIDPEKFYNYYESVDWKGVTDWKAKARYWNISDKKKKEADSKIKPPGGLFNSYSQRTYTEAEIEEILKRKGNM